MTDSGIIVIANSGAIPTLGASVRLVVRFGVEAVECINFPVGLRRVEMNLLRCGVHEESISQNARFRYTQQHAKRTRKIL